eukprot:g1721.t1
MSLTDALIVAPCALGLVWSAKECVYLRNVKLNGHAGSLLKQDSLSGEDAQKIVASMTEIGGYIAEGANAFLMKAYQYMAIYVVLFSCILTQVNMGTVVSFIVGSITSILSGYIGMKIAVYTNTRTAHECWKDLASGYDVAIRGGCVMGLSLVSLGVLALYALITVYTSSSDPFGFAGDKSAIYDAIAGFGLGMGADLFGSFAESTCAALVVGASSGAFANGIADNWSAMMFPVTTGVLVSSTGILVGIVTLCVVNQFYPVRDLPDVEKALKGILVISTFLEIPVILLLAKMCLPDGTFDLAANATGVTWFAAAVPCVLGAISGLIIGFVTEYYTSHSYRPVREISETQRVSAATGIIYGLALGYLSCVIPVACLGLTILVAYTLCGSYGVALGAIGMLSTMTMGLTIDVYGPISDNAGGIAEMCGMGAETRRRTDGLDAAGNTTAAIGKGFAIGSAALVSLALFGAYCVRADVKTVDILDPWCFSGLLYGAMMPYAFSAMTMKSVGEAANDMVNECMQQFPKILSGEIKPQYQRCISISTEASLREMLAPGALVILSPLVAGLCFGKNCTAGVLSGALVSGVQLAISMSNSGGAWDNAKKYIEAGGLGPEFGKGSSAHKNAVTGDTVGDPLKDTSGPSLNIVVKLSAIMSLVFGSVIAEWSNKETGGPFWLHSAPAAAPAPKLQL